MILKTSHVHGSVNKMSVFLNKFKVFALKFPVGCFGKSWKIDFELCKWKEMEKAVTNLKKNKVGRPSFLIFKMY